MKRYAGLTRNCKSKWIKSHLDNNWDYRGEIIVALHNDSDKCETIRSGDRIAQLIIMPYLSVKLNEVTELSDTARSDGGFGSTGIGDDKYVQLSLFDA